MRQTIAVNQSGTCQTGGKIVAFSNFMNHPKSKVHSSLNINIFDGISSERIFGGYESKVVYRNTFPNTVNPQKLA